MVVAREVCNSWNWNEITQDYVGRLYWDCIVAAHVLKQKNKARIVIKWMIYNQTHRKLLEIVVC